MSNSDKDQKKPSESDVESPSDGSTPDWLKDIRSGKTKPDADASAESGDESAGELTDLERLLAEEGIDLGSVDEDRPEGSEGMSARDWMISTSDDELIRRRIGADTPLEETDDPAPAPTEATSEANQEPVSELSDLERLLAEEGIDLEAVGEDRPEGSEGMSARDWMISTSDDELIRRRIGADTPLEETDDPAPAPPAAPVEQNIEADETEDDKMVVEEDLPDWLREIDEDEDVDFSELPAGDDDDKMVDEAGLPDWLQDIEASEEAERTTQTVPEAELEDSGDSDELLPDWLGDFDETTASATSAVEPVAEEETDDDDKMVVEEDLPDWLREVDNDVDAGADTVAADEDDGIVVTDDLPDWLKAVEDDEPAAASLDLDPEVKTAAGEDLPDWLSDADEPEAPSAELDDTPVAAAAPTVESADEEELPDWLSEVQNELPVAPAEAQEESLAADDEELPDWLREVQDESDAEAVAQPAAAPAPTESEPVALDDEDLPDWLREVDDEAVEDIQLEAPVTAAVQADEDDLPEWLKEATGEEEIEAAGLTVGEDSLVDEEDLPDWLSEAEAEGDDPFEPSDPSPEEMAEVVVTEELPDWLRETEDDTLSDTVDDRAAALPPAEAVAEPIEAEPSVEATDLPDWLRAESETKAPSDEAAVEEPEVVASAAAPPEPDAVESDDDEATSEMDEAEPVTEPVPEALPVAQAEPPPQKRAIGQLPDWLKKLRAGAPEPTTEQPVAASMAAAQSETKTADAIGAPAKFDRSVLHNLPQDTDKRLEMAREARERGEIEEAIPIYSSLVSNGAHLTSVIEDLQQSLKVYPTNYMLYQVMGDAMMRDERLQNALEAYRQALTKLTG